MCGLVPDHCVVLLSAVDAFFYCFNISELHGDGDSGLKVMHIQQ